MLDRLARGLAGTATVAALAVVTAGCTPSRHVTDRWTTAVITQTRPAAVDTAPLADGPVTRRDGSCPFIATQDAADLEGNRIGRVVVMQQRGRSIGCEFYFDPSWGYPRMTMRIGSARYSSAAAAYQAMVRAGGRDAYGVHGLVTGVDAVLYRTRFYAPDADRDWACTFAKDATVVTVVTDQTKTSMDARDVAAAIAPRW